VTTIDAPLVISCTDNDCDSCADGGGPHQLRCHCGAVAVELLHDQHGALPHCRRCLDLLAADAPLPTALRWPASVTQRGEHPVFVDVYRRGTHPMHEAPVPSAREFRRTVRELTLFVAGLLRVVR
jgi:hypothetical protein